MRTLTATIQASISMNGRKAMPAGEKMDPFYAGTDHVTPSWRRFEATRRLVPQVGDQRYWADRLHRLGVAPAGRPMRGLEGPALAYAAHQAAADAGLHAAARALAERMAGEDGVGAAVSRLERLTAG